MNTKRKMLHAWGGLVRFCRLINAWFKETWKKIPILGPLVYCSRKNHADTLKELLVTLLFSTTTFWTTVVFLKAYTSNSGVPVFELFRQTVSAGQLFIFSVTFLGPVYLIAGEDPENAKVFPNRGVHLVVLFPIALLAGGLYAIQFGARTSQGSHLLDDGYLLHASIYIAALAVVLRYLTVVYRKSTISFNPEAELVEPSQLFAEKFAARHDK